MNKRPALDLELLIPVLIGGFSVVGILAVLFIGRLLNEPAEIPATPSSTPFQYVYLGTEPAITTLVVDGSELPPTEEAAGEFPFTEEPIEVFPTEFATATRPSITGPTRPSGATPIILTPPNAGRTATSTRTRTPTATNSTAAAANTYDDTDSRIDYSESPGWVTLTDVTGAYQETLHISNTVGNMVTFTFTGTEIHVFYQAGRTQGTMTITIDSFGEPPISQAQDTTQIKEWVASNLSNVPHRVDIQHTSGGSINIDRFFIPAATPTPTRTPTP
jgi:hypothetical protein